MNNQQSIQYALMCLRAFKDKSTSWRSAHDISREQGVPFDSCVAILENLTSGGLLIEEKPHRYQLATPAEEMYALDVVKAASTPAPKTTPFRPWYGQARFRGIRKTLEAVALAERGGDYPSDTGRFWKGLIAVLLAGALGFSATPAEAGYNVGTKFADVIMEHVQPGKIYNLRTMRNLPYRVENRSNGEVELQVEVEIPSKEQLKPGYEAIVDPSWIKLVPGRLKLAAGEEGLVDVILQVPPGEEYVGRHFQAHLTATTPEPPPGQVTALSFGIALSSRLRFSVGSAGPEEIRRLQKQGIYQMLNFTLEPDLQYVPGFMVPGKKVDLSEMGVRLSLINRSPQTLNFKVASVPAPGGMAAASGYEYGKPEWIKVKHTDLKVPGDSIKSTSITLELPDDPAIRGKRFMFVIQGGLQGRDIPVEVYSRVYISVAK